MGHINVEYKGKWAEFSTNTDSFNTVFDDKETYENYRKQELGERFYRPIDERFVRTIEDVAHSIRLIRSHEEALECLLEAGLTKEEGEKVLYDVETKHYCPIKADDGTYRCPNCNEVVEKGQKTCHIPDCELKFVWRE